MAAQKQLEEYAAANKAPPTLTATNGAPVATLTASMTAGARGPMTISDLNYLDVMFHFDRERAPERVVHAKGMGAFGEFEVTHDITKYTRAAIFSTIGKKTPMAARLSTVAGESGSADTVRDPRGFALKFYTEEGNWDLVCNNTPVFFVRDPILFPTFIHCLKRNPQTHLKDPIAFWDFLSLRPESCHMVSMLFSDRGTPDGFRHMHGFGNHAFKLVNAKGEAVYAKFHFLTNQGIKNLTPERAVQLAGEKPDYALEDLYNAIARGDFPSWTLYIQVMTFQQAKDCPFNPFDNTKIWPHGDYPLMPVGKMTLNKNVTNYFAEVEQIAFNPANLIPGVEPSPDKMLQGRLFSYQDTQHHRLGPNPYSIPVNCPYRARMANYNRDTLRIFPENNQGNGPTYFPNSFNGPQPSEHARWQPDKISGDVDRYETGDEDNYSQAGAFWNKALDDQGRANLAKNIGAYLALATPEIQKRMIGHFTKCDPAYGKAVQENLDKYAISARV